MSEPLDIDEIKWLIEVWKQHSPLCAEPYECPARPRNAVVDYLIAEVERLREEVNDWQQAHDHLDRWWKKPEKKSEWPDPKHQDRFHGTPDEKA